MEKTESGNARMEKKVEKTGIYRSALKIVIGGMFGLGFLWAAHMFGWLYSLFMAPVRSVGWLEWMVVGSFVTGIFAHLMGMLRFSFND